ncbi:MAG: dehydrogenase E1 component subunit alpha/beta [Gemmatimonadota bacterium]|nr:MAG: dehydrogenase E1 component subunit alpha/beta [Gemmatimonadota bacterium]
MATLAGNDWKGDDRTSDLGPDQLVDIYRTILLSRRIDDKEMQLKRGNRIFFQISGAGHEAIGVAAALALKPGYDWFYTYYRDRALCLQLGVTPYEMFLQGFGSVSDPASGGRQMPSHWGHAELNIVTSSSPTGTQFLGGVGCAEAGQRYASIDELRNRSDRFEEDEVVLVTCGDGTTSQGEFWEAINTAANLKLPVIFLVEDNEYAISVPVEVQTAGGSISQCMSGVPGLMIDEVDGCDPLASYETMRRAVAHCRARQGPALVQAHVIRPYSHSMSDDERLYRSEEERQKEAERDPVVSFARVLLDRGVITEEGLEKLGSEIDSEIQEAVDRAAEVPQPEPDTATLYVYSPDVDPTSDEFATEPQFGEGDPTTMVDLLNACLRDEMERDPAILMFGEDVADASREAALDEVKGKGGVFKVTWGLQKRFGSERVYNSPLAEANIVGRAVGLAQRGLKPVVEIQFFDYIWTAMMQLRDEVPLIRWRSNNAFKCPMVVRVTYGGYLKGGAVYHSQTGASIFAHTPGMHVVCPTNAEDANGLLRTAIRCDDPVLFLEHKHLYRQTYNKGRYPGPEYMIPFGCARKVREGSHLTVITYGATVERSARAAKAASEEAGIEAEVIDLRTLNPVDMATITESLKRTNKALVVYEDPLSWGYGAEIAARVADELFEWLDGPVRRVAALDTFVAYAPQLEDAILPQVDDIQAAILDLARY